MLVSEDLVRDVLCCEVLQLRKYISSNDVNAQGHLNNIVEILMSQHDFIHVDTDVSAQEFVELVSNTK